VEWFKLWEHLPIKSDALSLNVSAAKKQNKTKCSLKIRIFVKEHLYPSPSFHTATVHLNLPYPILGSNQFCDLQEGHQFRHYQLVLKSFGGLYQQGNGRNCGVSQNVIRQYWRKTCYTCKMAVFHRHWVEEIIVFIYIYMK
jgi:hypothetical protein